MSSHRMRSSQAIGGAAAAAALFLIGTSAPVAVGLSNYPLLGGQALRFALAAAILLALTHWRAGPGPRMTVRLVAGIALLGLVGIAAFNVLLVTASQHADPALIGTMLAAAPIALAVLDPLLRGRRLSLNVVTGCILVTVGTAVGAGLGNSSALGFWLGFGALLGEVAFALLAVPLIHQLGALRTTAYAVSAAAVQLSVVAAVTEGTDALMQVPTESELLALLYMAVAIAVLANLLWYAALSRIGADQAAVFYAFTPIGALVAGLLLHTSAPTLATVLSLALVVTGLLVGLTPSRGKDVRTPDASTINPRSSSSPPTRARSTEPLRPTPGPPPVHDRSECR